MLFDTHCHLNFSAFERRVGEVIKRANEAGVNYIVVPGTDFETSQKAVGIASSFPNIYAVVGIHPHHIFEMLQKKEKPEIKNELKKIEDLLTNKNVIAVGEVGIDRHIYDKTKYQNYQIEQEFIDLQKEFLKEQIKLAIKYKKSLIFHNREAKKDFLEVLSQPAVVKALAGKAVFHCCEPDTELLDFARSNKFFIGVDGDIVYRQDKQEFVKKIPLDMLVLETDSPFLAPDRKFPNEPAQVAFIAKFIANILDLPKEKLAKITTENAKRLFLL
jgi:TatD DNase family protein